MPLYSEVNTQESTDQALRTPSEAQSDEVVEQALGRPWITYAIIVICGAIFAYLNLAKSAPSYNRISMFLIPSTLRIWDGAYWGLLTAAFVHLVFWHILFNVMCARDFGSLIEPTMGRAKYLLFIIAAAFVSSGGQLAISDQTGVGFSGVVYAMFGYALAARHVEPRYRLMINWRVILWMLGWLVLCIVLTFTGIWNVANGAHMAGFLFGYCAGNVFTARAWLIPSRIGLALLVALTVMTASYMPWSQAWKSRGDFLKLSNVAEDAANGKPDAQFVWGVLQAQSKKKVREGISWLRKSADQGFVPAMNYLAWTLATNRDDHLRNGAEAVQWAEAACRDDNWQTAGYVDTLAAAYAEVERWDLAVDTQKLAISKLTSADAKRKSIFESQLQQYLNHLKMRK
jgi:membrane associated rhomboid family serine protease